MLEPFAFTIGPDGSLRLKGDLPLEVPGGTWRALSASSKWLIMGREDEPQAQTRLALFGDIEATGGLCDIVGLIHQCQWTGALVTWEGLSERTVLFQKGNIRTALSNLPQDRLGEVLFRYGVVTQEQLEEGLKRAQGAQRLGQALVELEYATTLDVFNSLRRQVEEIFFATVLLRGGTFAFERVGLDESLPDLGLSTQNLLFEGIRRMDEMKFFRERIPNSAVIPQRRSGPTEPPEDESTVRILDLIDGARSIEALARKSKLGEFEATRAVFQLLQSGHVELQLQRSVGDNTLQQVNGRGVSLHDLVEVLNELLAKIHAKLAKSNKAERFRADVGAFFRGATTYAPLFAGVEVQESGRIPTELVLANLEMCPVKSPWGYLHEGLNELLLYLVFSVGESIGREEEQELTSRLNEIVAELDARSAKK